MLRRDLVIAPVCEAALILVVATASWLTHSPLLFASLGPTAYELIETPERASARPYNVLVGHLIGVLSGFAALYLTHAWAAQPISSGYVAFPRIWAAALAAMVTVLGTLLARASQPAAIATSLLIALGLMQQARDGLFIMAAVGLLTLVGEPLRRWRERDQRRPERKG